MIYLVSTQDALFEDEVPYKRLSKEEALKLILTWDVVEYDSETTGSLKLSTAPTSRNGSSAMGELREW